MLTSLRIEEKNHIFNDIQLISQIYRVYDAVNEIEGEHLYNVGVSYCFNKEDNV